ncbi:multicopper oxidase family protein [Edaphobacter aggregans]|uniref:multicopper oxidase family protein n=1 Tax=Edaphobacter aggregans TaxID=570835 RepID=UPI001FDFDAA3|nr:multicopper oxidase family protein [Edaphobacter aggregans]
MAAGASMVGKALALAAADYSLTIAPYSLEVAPKKFVKTMAYNGQVPGAVLRMKEGVPVTVEVANRSEDDEVVHWHGLFLPPEVDGAMEEGTPHIAAGASARYTFTPYPAGFRWYHTHVMAGHDLKRGLYTGLHGFLLVEPRENPARYDQEVFLALHDWDGVMVGSDDGSMSPVYRHSTINGKRLGFGEPLRVKQGQRVLLHVVNTSATDPHWIAMTGHKFRVVTLDGSAVPTPCEVSMLHLSPAERVSAELVMDNPGVWALGEVRRSVMAAGMGMVVEYAGRTGKPVWQQPQTLDWDYLQFGASAPQDGAAVPSAPVNVTSIPLVFESKFAGHGAMDRWMINGKSFPDTETVALRQGQRYRLVFRNKSMDDHPVHLHRHTFELKKMAGRETRGVMKDTVLVKAGTEAEVEFTANAPGLSLFHCHQQDHMDMGFMMLFRCS